LDKGGGYGRGRGVRFGVKELFGLREVSEKYFGSAVDGVLDSGGMGRRRSVRAGGALCMDWLMFAIISCSIRKVSPGPLPGLAVLEVLCGGEWEIVADRLMVEPPAFIFDFGRLSRGVVYSNLFWLGGLLGIRSLGFVVGIAQSWASY